MKPLIALLIAVSTFAACGKSAEAPTATAPLPGITGGWTGYLQNGQNAPIVMTLKDSSGIITGIARFGDSYAITGQLLGSSVSLNATNSANESWAFSGTMETGTMSGNVSYGSVSNSIIFYKN